MTSMNLLKVNCLMRHYCSFELELDSFKLSEEKILYNFWEPGQQKNIRNDLFGRKYDLRRGNSYHRYVMHLYFNAQYLDIDFTEEHLILMYCNPTF